MICCLAYGVILLTAFYLVFCLAIATQLPDCIVQNEETDVQNCGTEGVDNSVLAWSTSYFVATIVGFIALHVWWKSSKRILGVVAFGSIALAMVFHGTTARFFGNSGTDDGKGMKGYYVSICGFCIVMTLSAILFAFLGHQTWQQFEASRVRCCGRKEMGLFLFLLVASAFIIVFGCVSTLSLGDEVLVKTTYDDYPKDPYQVPLSLEVVKIGMKMWNACYSLFLIALAVIWGMAAKMHPVKIGGLPNSLAAGGIVLLQGSVGIFRAVLLSISGSVHIQESTVNRVAPAVFNFVILLTAFLMHNWIVSLFPKDPEDFDGSKYDSQASTDSDDNRDIEAQQGFPRESSGVSGNSQSVVSGEVTVESGHQVWDVTLKPHSQTDAISQVSKQPPVDDQTELECEGVEVMGIPTDSTTKVKKSLFSMISPKFLLQKVGPKMKSPQIIVSSENCEQQQERDGKSMSSPDASKSEKSETTFGSQVLKKVAPEYQDGSQTSFGSANLQKVKRVDPENATDPHKGNGKTSQGKDASGESMTSFGSQILHKTKKEDPVYENASQTTFGSSLLQKVRQTKSRTDESDSMTENPGIEVVGMPRLSPNTSPDKTSGHLLSRIGLNLTKSRDKSLQTPARAMSNVKKALESNDADESETSFGSQVLKKEMHLANERGSETSFGSQMLEKAKKKIPVYEEGSNTTFGSEVLQKMRPVYENGSETTFGSEMLQKVRRVYNEENGIATPASANRRLPMLSKFRQKKNADVTQESLGSETTFGSQILQKEKKPEYESESDGSLTSFGSEVLMKIMPRRLRGDADDSIAGSSTTFGSQRLVKATPRLMRYESDGSITTFGSEILVKARVEYRAYESKHSSADVVSTHSERSTEETKNTSFRAPVNVALQDSSERSAASSTRVAGVAATDPAHLDNMDKIYGWMSKFVPVDGVNMARRKLPKDNSDTDGLKEEFEIQLGTPPADDGSEAVEELDATRETEDIEEPEDDKVPGIMSRLRPMRTKKKKSWRKQYQQSQETLDIPNAIEEDADEEMSQASGRRSGSPRDDASSVAVVMPPTVQETVEENIDSANQPMDPVVTVAKVGSQASLRRDEQSGRSGGSVSSGYSTDNTTIISTKPIVMAKDPLEGGIPKELAESRDDDYSTDSDEEYSQSYASSSAAPSEFQSYILEQGGNGNEGDDIVSVAESSQSSIHLNKMTAVPQMEKATAIRRQRQASNLDWAKFE
jgi:hypothetical protein